MGIFEAIKGFFKTRKERSSVIGKYNARLDAMKKSGNVDTDYIKENLSNAGIEFTSRGKISTKGLTAENLRALEAQIPNSTGDRGYVNFGKEIQAKKAYDEQRKREIALQIAEQRYKDDVKSLLTDVIEAYYDGEDPKTRDYSEFFYGKSLESQVKIGNMMREFGKLVNSKAPFEELVELREQMLRLP